jgi:hypothetical protein
VHCTWLLERDLLAAEDLAEELDVTRYRLSAVAAWSGAPVAGGTTPLPFDPRAAQAALELHRVLDVWAARLETAANPGRPVHTAGLARWLTHRHDELAGRPDAPAAAVDIGRVVTAGWRAVDRPADRVYAGACDCGEQLYAGPTAATVVCRGCDSEHVIATRRERMLAELDSRLMTGAEIARLGTYFGQITDRERARGLIKVWAARGLVVARGHSKAGAPLYPFGEVLDRLLDAAVATSERSVLPSTDRERTVSGPGPRP